MSIKVKECRGQWGFFPQEDLPFKRDSYLHPNARIATGRFQIVMHKLERKGGPPGTSQIKPCG